LVKVSWPLSTILKEGLRMKKLLALILGLGMTVGTAGLYAAGFFEGEVDYNLNSKQHDGTVSYFMKGKKILAKTITNGYTGDVIIDMEAREITMIMTAQKMYTTITLPPSNSSTLGKGTFTDTGRSDVILGKTCEEWLYQGPKGSSSVWGAHGLGNFFAFGGRPNDPSAAWADAVKHNGLFPLKVISKDADGNVMMTMEATKITPGTLEASLFQVPAGFNKMDLGDMGAMMGQHPPQ
jgi:hypothetical protein